MAKEVTNTFWGVTLNAGKKYSQTLESAVHVSMAALEPGSNGGDDGAVSVVIQHKKSDFVLCSLSGRHVFQQSLDLNFNEGEEVTFYLKGKGKVHLTGNLIQIDDNYDSASDDDFQPQSSFVESESADDDDTSSDEDTDHSEASKKRKKLLAALKQSKKPKVEIVDDEDDDEDEMDTDDDEEDDDDETPKRQENAEKKCKMQAPPAVPAVKQSKETKNEEHKETDKGANSSNQSESSEKKKKKKKKKKNKKNELTSTDSTNLSTEKQVNSKSRVVEDVTIEDLKIGHGPEAKKGSTVNLYYTGKLPNGKVFDSRTSGKTFKFHLGKKEVISGWEVGVEGMKVGGKRKLVIPPKMGYGSQNVGGGNIPPNSTLHFEVELKAVN